MEALILSKVIEHQRIEEFFHLILDSINLFEKKQNEKWLKEHLSEQDTAEWLKHFEKWLNKSSIEKIKASL